MSIPESVYHIMDQVAEIVERCNKIKRLIETTSDRDQLLQFMNELNNCDLKLDVLLDDVRSIQVETLPKYEFSSASNDGSEQCCAVCLNDFQLNEIIRKLPCAHDFHSDCVDKWIKLHQTCPMCRACTFDG
ncbi:RING-H2 finger protein ATL70-like [Glossina fuscipes]|uniref:RING-H2 finger protein ATL70-like n=1 Tax=Glossina fuscipes TaxID=7396 RepID=A0A9C5YYT6_9MUSC|nr:RING-H2 finger protein ATL70-like [Glossina fuscipes]